MRNLQGPTPSAGRTSRTPLLDLLKQKYDLEELRTLCFELGVNFDDLPGEGRAAKARELILRLESHGRLGELISTICTEHPEVAKAELYEFSGEVATAVPLSKGGASSSSVSDGSLGRVTVALIIPLILWLGVPITLLLLAASPRDTPRLPTGASEAFGSLLRDSMGRSLLLVSLAIVWLAVGWVLLKRMRWKPRNLIAWLIAGQTGAEPFYVFADHRDLMRYLLPRVKGTPVDDQDIPYIDRGCHDIMEAFRPGARILISGRTKCGKTREAIHLIEVHSHLGLTILVPKPGSTLDINPAALNTLPTRGLVLLLDDLHRFFPNDRDQLGHCVQTLAEHCDSPSELIVVATTRDEKEYQDRLQFDTTTTGWKDWRHFRLKDVTSDEAVMFIRQVAELTSIKISENLVRALAARNDGTFLNLMLTFRYWAQQLVTTIGEADVAGFRITLAETWKRKWNEMVRQDRYVAAIGSAIRFLYDQDLPILERVVIHVAFLQHLSSLTVVTLFGSDLIATWLRNRLFDFFHPWQGKSRTWLIYATPIAAAIIFLALLFLRSVMGSYLVQLARLALTAFVFLFALLIAMLFARQVAWISVGELPTKLQRAFESVRAETPHLDNLLVPYEAQTEIYQVYQDGLLVQSTGTILRPPHSFIRQVLAQEIMLNRIAWWYTRWGFLDAGARIAFQAFKLAPRNEIVAWRTAEILKESGDLARATAVLRAAASHEKSTWRGVLLRDCAFVELDRGQTTKANHMIESLVARFPRSGYVQSLVLIKARTKDWDHAEQALSLWLAIKPSTGAVRWLQEQLEKHPDSDPRYARLMRQIAQWTQRRSFRVNETLQQWIIFLMNSGPARVTANFVSLLWGAIVTLAVGVAVVIGIVQWQPDAAHTLKVDTLVEYMQTFIEHRQVQRTIDELGRDLQSDPYDASAILRRGKAYLDIGNYEEAIADFTHLIEMRQGWPDPLTAVAMGDRAIAYSWMQRYDEALTDLNNAIVVSPDPWLLTRRARVLEAQGRYSEAMADANAAIGNDPTWGWARLLRGELLQEQGQYGEALLDFAHAIELDPRDDYAYYMRAQCYIAQQRFELAEADLFQAVKLSPYDSLYQSALHNIRETWIKR